MVNERRPTNSFRNFWTPIRDAPDLSLAFGLTYDQKILPRQGWTSGGRKPSERKKKRKEAKEKKKERLLVFLS